MTALCLDTHVCAEPKLTSVFEWAVDPSIRSGHPLGLSNVGLDIDLNKVSFLKSSSGLAENRGPQNLKTSILDPSVLSNLGMSPFEASSFFPVK